MWIRKGSRSNMNQDYRCTICRGEGMYLKENSAVFCACAYGQRRKSAWMKVGETASLPDFILHTLRTHHQGKSRAITREDLLSYLHSLGYGLSDRDLREIYAELPIVSSSQGLFWPETAAELQEYRQYLKAKAIPLFERWQRVAQAHPELIDATQGELFP